MPWVFFFPLETLHVLTDVFTLFETLTIQKVSLSHICIKDARGIEMPFGLTVNKTKGEKDTFTLSFHPFSAHLEKPRTFHTMATWKAGDSPTLSFIGKEELSALMAIGTFTDYVICMEHDDSTSVVSPVIDSSGTPIGVRMGTNAPLHSLHGQKNDIDTVLGDDLIPFGVIVADGNGVIGYANSIASSQAHDVNNSLVGKYIDVKNIEDYPLCSDSATFIDNATISICDVSTFDSPVFVTLNKSFTTYVIIPHYLMEDISYAIERRGSGEIGTSVLHEIKTPLVTLGAYISYIEEDLETGAYDSLRENVKSIRHALGQVSGQIERLENTELANDNGIHAAPIINRVVRSHYKELSDYEVTVEHSLDSIHINIDKASFGFIMDSLLNFLVSQKPFSMDGEMRIGCKNSEDGVLIYIRDSAVSLSNEMMEGFFLDSSTHVGPSSILGEEMSMAMSLVETANGNIWAEPVSDAGTMLWIYIPSNSAKAMCKFKDFHAYMALEK